MACSGNDGPPSTGASLSSCGNLLSAVGAANGGQSILTLAGRTATATGALLSQRTNEAPVTAGLTDTTVSITVAGSTFTGPTVAASNNVLRALGYGNQVQNTVGTSFGTIDAGAHGGPVFSNAVRASSVNSAVALGDRCHCRRRCRGGG